MDKHYTKLLRILLNAYYGDNVANVCRFLPEEEAEQIKSLEIPSKDFSFVFQKPEEWLEKIHYSWLAPIVSKYEPPLRALIVASLSDYQRACLRQYLSLDNDSAPPPLARAYILKDLCEKLGIKEEVPAQELPDSTFNSLIHWSKDRLCTLVDLLSMYDLSDKLKHIVDRKRLRDIYACLNKECLDYLRICMHKKEQITSLGINLDTWKGDPKELEHLLHKRGLVRFGKALSTEPPETLWHILHCLDTGRSAIIQKCLTGTEPPAVIHVLKQQVLSVIEYLDTKTTS